MPPRRKSDVPTSNGDAGQAVPRKRPRAKRALRSAPPAASSLSVDKQLQQRDQQLQWPHADTTRTKVEEDSLSEASTLVMGTSLSPSRLNSPDAVRTAAASVITSDTPGSAASTLPPKAKRQRARNDGVVEAHGKRIAAAAAAAAGNSGSSGQPANTAAAPAAALVYHAVVPQKTGRAKRTVSRCRHEFPRDIFIKRAIEGCAALPQDLANR